MSHVDDHVDETQLHAYIDRELEFADEQVRRQVGQHIADCNRCAKLLKEVRAVHRRANQLLGMARPPERPVPSFQDIVRRAEQRRSAAHQAIPDASNTLTSNTEAAGRFRRPNDDSEEEFTLEGLDEVLEAQSDRDSTTDQQRHGAPSNTTTEEEELSLDDLDQILSREDSDTSKARADRSTAREPHGPPDLALDDNRVGQADARETPPAPETPSYSPRASDPEPPSIDERRETSSGGQDREPWIATGAHASEASAPQRPVSESRPVAGAASDTPRKGGVVPYDQSLRDSRVPEAHALDSQAPRLAEQPEHSGTDTESQSTAPAVSDGIEQARKRVAELLGRKPSTTVPAAPAAETPTRAAADLGQDPRPRSETPQSTLGSGTNDFPAKSAPEDATVTEARRIESQSPQEQSASSPPADTRAFTPADQAMERGWTQTAQVDEPGVSRTGGNETITTPEASTSQSSAGEPAAAPPIREFETRRDTPAASSEDAGRRGEFVAGEAVVSRDGFDRAIDETAASETASETSDSAQSGSTDHRLEQAGRSDTEGHGAEPDRSVDEPPVPQLEEPANPRRFDSVEPPLSSIANSTETVPRASQTSVSGADSLRAGAQPDLADLTDLAEAEDHDDPAADAETPADDSRPSDDSLGIILSGSVQSDYDWLAEGETSSAGSDNEEVGTPDSAVSQAHGDQIAHGVTDVPQSGMGDDTSVAGTRPSLDLAPYPDRDDVPEPGVIDLGIEPESLHRSDESNAPGRTEIVHGSDAVSAMGNFAEDLFRPDVPDSSEETEVVPAMQAPDIPDENEIVFVEHETPVAEEPAPESAADAEPDVSEPVTLRPGRSRIPMLARAAVIIISLGIGGWFGRPYIMQRFGGGPGDVATEIAAASADLSTGDVGEQEQSPTEPVATPAGAGSRDDRAERAAVLADAQTDSRRTRGALESTADVTVMGVVRDAATGEALARAQVGVAGTELRTMTDESGRYTLANVPPGSRQVDVQQAGYQALSRNISGEQRQTVTADFALQSTRAAEAPVTAEPQAARSGAAPRSSAFAVAVVEISRDSARAVLGGPLVYVRGFRIVRITRTAIGSNVIVEQTDANDRTISLTIASPGSIGNRPTLENLQVTSAEGATPSTATARFGNYFLTVTASVPSDELESLMERIRTSP